MYNMNIKSAFWYDLQVRVNFSAAAATFVANSEKAFLLCLRYIMYHDTICIMNFFSFDVNPYNSIVYTTIFIL